MNAITNNHNSNYNTIEIDSNSIHSHLLAMNESNINFDNMIKIKEEKSRNGERNMLSFSDLFYYATKLDLLMMIIGTIAALANGLSFPFMMIVFNNIIDTFIYADFCPCIPNGTNLTPILTPTPPNEQNLTSKMRDQSIWLVVIGVSTTILSYFQVSFWTMPAERQTMRLRKRLFKSILRQDISWFDENKSGELSSRLNEDINKVKSGIGDKMGSCIQLLSTFIAGIVISLYRGWKLSLIIMSIAPILLVIAVVFIKIASFLSSNEIKSYARAGSIVEEVITAIRTVFAFNGASHEHKKYEKELERARIFGIKKSAITGLLLGIIWLVVNSSYALGFWVGWLFTERDPVTCESEYTIGKILLVFFSIIMGIFSLGQAAPFMGTLTEAKAAAYEIFKIIRREPMIDSYSTLGHRLNIKGNISFKNVYFNYPSRPEVKILNNFSMDVRAGSTVALVGTSGCGKSTCINLIQRFYDITTGYIKIDNTNVNEFNLNWLRSQIGVVNQEPILFDTTIADNIRCGKYSDNTNDYANQDITQEDIEKAAKQANAHDFIMKLPQKYETVVGSRGSQLSGGQKQRIAIARALIRNPKILLLDEATSALDNESERFVQVALDKASKGRTTIIVAHRLSTIRHVDKIFVINNGCVVEIGNHTELINKGGVYRDLVISQEVGLNDIKTSYASTNNYNEVSQSFDKNPFDDDYEVDVKSPKKKTFEMKRLLLENKPEWGYIFVGCIASLISGSVMPAFAYVLSEVTNVFSVCDRKKQEEDIMTYCILFIAFGVILFVSYIFQALMFGISGENLTKRLRSKAFKSILSQEVAWFDQVENSVGVLSTRLSTEAAAVQGVSGVTIGFLLLNIGNLGIGLGLSFAYSWTITLLVLGFMPFIIISGILQTKLLTGFSASDKAVLEKAGNIANESISNIRTVITFNLQKYFYNLYMKNIEIPYKCSFRTTNIYGILFGFTNSIMFYAISASFLLGAYLIDNKLYGVTIKNILLVFNCIVFGAQSAGVASTFMPDLAKAKSSAINLFKLFDRKPIINNFEPENSVSLKDNELSEAVVFKSVQFKYPSRKNVTVLDDLSLSLNKGQRIALVGSSGSGKSTITQLLERFYDPIDGEILVNGCNINELNIFSLRSKIGIVSQEPILFDASIYDNIAYGDLARSITEEEIVDAAKKANVHEFISSLPQGYQTNVGSKGTQLSGGQKQRIAIARALIRNPKILLLDEATSALDAESERVVQDALDKAQKGKTCIIIAHRLSTIQNCDCIYVMKEGRIIEYGTHQELLDLNGYYGKFFVQETKL